MLFVINAGVVVFATGVVGAVVGIVVVFVVAVLALL